MKDPVTPVKRLTPSKTATPIKTAAPTQTVSSARVGSSPAISSAKVGTSAAKVTTPPQATTPAKLGSVVDAPTTAPEMEPPPPGYKMSDTEMVCGRNGFNYLFLFALIQYVASLRTRLLYFT